MAVLPILWAPDPMLKTKCATVEEVDDDLRLLLDNMLETMYAAPGIGLAAPQIGVSRRVLVADVAKEDQPPNPVRMINPEVVAESEETGPYEEGCLSLPGHYAEVIRPLEVEVRYTDETGAEKTIGADGLLARCLQHEIDHLGGVLFVDHLSMLKRNMIIKKMVKAKKQRAAEG